MAGEPGLLYRGMLGKGKTGQLSEPDVAASSGLLDSVNSAAAGAGATITEQDVSIPGLGLQGRG